MPRYQKYMDAVYKYICINGPATCEQLRAGVRNWKDEPFVNGPNYQQLPMWMRGDKRFKVVGKHINRYRSVGGPYPVDLWGLKNEE